jgi:hypothetical protein
MMGMAMQQTREALKVRRLEQELAAERTKRIELQTQLGGLRSVNTRLQRALVFYRPETEKLKGDRQNVA